MTIRYNNGFSYEAILLARTEETMRVAITGSDDVVELKQIHGAWISEDCEPVQVEFAWTRQAAAPETTEESCTCSHELAAELIHLLFSGENEPVAAPVAQAMSAPVYHQVV
jgi:hypothetical protein